MTSVKLPPTWRLQVFGATPPVTASDAVASQCVAGRVTAAIDTE